MAIKRQLPGLRVHALRTEASTTSSTGRTGKETGTRQAEVKCPSSAAHDAALREAVE